MHRFLSTLALFLTFGTGSAIAQNATVVELYTSQGCSSCPPADEILAEIAQRDDVIALALHVDYWDYIGWKDDLANPEYTKRQRAYARSLGERTVYTPQMFFGGTEHVIGSRPMKVMDQIQAHGNAPDAVTVSLSRNGNELQINATGSNLYRGDAVVQIVRYTPEVVRDIRRGENAGKTISYANVVYSWHNAGTWNTRSPLSMQATLTGDDPVVVIIQEGTDGRILGAAQVR